MSAASSNFGCDLAAELRGRGRAKTHYHGKAATSDAILRP